MLILTKVDIQNIQGTQEVEQLLKEVIDRTVSAMILALSWFFGCLLLSQNKMKMQVKNVVWWRRENNWLKFEAKKCFFGVEAVFCHVYFFF
jgi:hypothetical protein